MYAEDSYVLLFFLCPGSVTMSSANKARISSAACRPGKLSKGAKMGKYLELEDKLADLSNSMYTENVKGNGP